MQVHQSVNLTLPPHKSNSSKTYILCSTEVHQLVNLPTTAQLRLRQDLQTVSLRSPSISKSFHPRIDQNQVRLTTCFHASSSVSKFGHPRMTQTQARLTIYFSQKVQQLANLFTSAYLRLKQDLLPISLRSPSISKSDHPRITQTQVGLTSYFSQKSIN